VTQQRAACLAYDTNVLCFNYICFLVSCKSWVSVMGSELLQGCVWGGGAGLGWDMVSGHVLVWFVTPAEASVCAAVAAARGAVGLHIVVAVTPPMCVTAICCCSCPGMHASSYSALPWKSC
jgi:hypothetical protein